MISLPKELLEYYASGKSLVCDLEECPYSCEFWPLDKIEKYNSEYQVDVYAPGFLGFATSGGGEMLAFSPLGAVVYIPFIGMEPEAALPLASTWIEFEPMLKDYFADRENEPEWIRK